MRKKLIFTFTAVFFVLAGSFLGAKSLDKPELILVESPPAVGSEKSVEENSSGSVPPTDPQDATTKKPQAQAVAPVQKTSQDEASKSVKKTASEKEAGYEVARSFSKPRVSGSAAFRTKINKALNLLHDRAPANFAKVQKYLTEIRESDHSGVLVETGVFTLGKGSATSQDEYWLASIIVHDAYHVELYRAGREYSGETGERLSILEQKKVLQLLGAQEEYQIHLDEIMNSKYWDVPYENRNW